MKKLIIATSIALTTLILSGCGSTLGFPTGVVNYEYNVIYANQSMAAIDKTVAATTKDVTVAPQDDLLEVYNQLAQERKGLSREHATEALGRMNVDLMHMSEIIYGDALESDYAKESSRIAKMCDFANYGYVVEVAVGREGGRIATGYGITLDSLLELSIDNYTENQEDDIGLICVNAIAGYTAYEIQTRDPAYLGTHYFTRAKAPMMESINPKEGSDLTMEMINEYKASSITMMKEIIILNRKQYAAKLEAITAN